MLDLFKQYATDESVENDGAWVTINGVRFLIARLGNRKYNKLLASLFEQNKEALERKGDDTVMAEVEKLSTSLMVDVLSQSILLGWDNSVPGKEVGYQGEILPYSVANAKLILGMKDFRTAVTKKSEDAEQYRVKLEVEQEKN